MKKLIVTVLGASFAITALSSTLSRQIAETVVPSKDKLLGKYEKIDRAFMRLQIDTLASYFHQRKIGAAIVEKDFIRYQFDVQTGELIEKKTRWRTDLPDQVTPQVTKEQAESVVEGAVEFTRLYFISPESDVFPIKPTPKNPCWVVRSTQDQRIIVTVIDAMTGEKLGYGTPPPAAGYSLSGPQDDKCRDSWNAWSDNARYWFNRMGYQPAIVEEFPRKSTIQQYLQNDNTAMFYEIAHGGSPEFQNWCVEWTHANDIRRWLESYANVPFAFLASCKGMCDYSDNTLSHEFRKGSNSGTVTVGYCNMDVPELCVDCWHYSRDWQNALFEWMSQGYSVGYAYFRANLAYPHCGLNNCMLIAGDIGLRVVPPLTRSLCGIALGWLAMTERDYYVRCDLTVPKIPFLPLNIEKNVRLAFMNDSKISVNGNLDADGSQGEIRFLSARNSRNGIKLTGQLKISNGGELRIYE